MIPNGFYDGVYTYFTREDIINFIEITTKIIIARQENPTKSISEVATNVTKSILEIFAINEFDVLPLEFKAGVSSVVGVLVLGIGVGAGTTALTTGGLLVALSVYIIPIMDKIIKSHNVIDTFISESIDYIEGVITTAQIRAELLRISGVENILKESSASLFRVKGKELKLDTFSKIEPLLF